MGNNWSSSYNAGGWRQFGYRRIAPLVRAKIPVFSSMRSAIIAPNMPQWHTGRPEAHRAPHSEKNTHNFPSSLQRVPQRRTGNGMDR